MKNIIILFYSLTIFNFAFGQDTLNNNISISVDDLGVVSWITKNETTKKIFVIEQYRWNKWIKVGEVDGLGNAQNNEYRFQIPLHSEANQVRITLGNDRDFSNTLKWVSKHPKVNYTIERKTKEIKFSNGTLYEIQDGSGKTVKRGFGETVSYKDLPKGTYALNFDSTTTELKL